MDRVNKMGLAAPLVTAAGAQRTITVYHAALKTGLPVALWQLPGAEPQAMVGLEAVGGLAPVDFRQETPGFVFAPFVTTQHNAALQMRAGVLFGAEGTTVQITTPAARAAHGRFMAALEARAGSGVVDAPRWYAPYNGALRPDRAADEDEFVRLVDDAISFIRSTGIAKVVVSRTARRPLPPAFDPAATFVELCVRYPYAFVSLVAIPGVGTWLGASPEVLLTLDAHALTTMALAGTQRRPENRPLAEITWGAKEVVEQEMVSAYIREFFHNAGVQNVVETGPSTIAAGNVVHLQTLFRVARPPAERLALANRVLQELHPTSAVCGMPKHKALAFILAHEGYDRSFYSGFLGPVHVEGQSSLYVNLRCMQLGAQTAHLYVGAGITAESNPEAEWRETEMKAETMLAVLGRGGPDHRHASS
ncbi:MAG: chorismate-binding protein [Caldilineaceae bacterium]|nr:chorismate-binding protein [Caldilineaceae bacterium]